LVFKGSFGHDRPSLLEHKTGRETPVQTYQISHPQSEWKNLFLSLNNSTKLQKLAIFTDRRLLSYMYQILKLSMFRCCYCMCLEVTVKTNYQTDNVKSTFLNLDSFAGFVQVMENLESHGIRYFNFQAWKVMEFKWRSWKVMEKLYAWQKDVKNNRRVRSRL